MRRTISNSTPYIGVTGITTASQRDALLHVAERWDSPHQVMVGVLASRKTMRGEATRYPIRYPKVQDIHELFSDHPRALNLVHYSSEGSVHLLNDLLSLTEYGGPHLHGFQVNVPWPNPRLLGGLHHETRARYAIVLQLGPQVLRDGDTPTAIAARVHSEYEGLIDAVLLDNSAGKGVPLDPERLAPYVRALSCGAPWVHVVVAGGLQVQTLALLNHLLETRSTLSIDAEGQLRTADDVLRMDETLRYLTFAQQKLTCALHATEPPEALAGTA